MKTIRLSILLIFLTACSMPDQARAQDILKPDRLQEDFQLFRHALEEAHPGLYRYLTHAEADSIFEAARGRLDHSMSRQQFYQILSPIIASIGCGHTKLHPDENWSSFFYFDADRVFPLKLFIRGNQAWVTGWWREGDTPTGWGTPSGSPLLSINGRPVEEIIERLKGGLYSDGRNTTFKYIEMSRYFSALYANWYGGVDTFRVVLGGDGGNREWNVAAIDHAVIEKAQEPQVLPEPYHLEFLPHHTASITISSFWEESRGMSYKKFLRKSFSALRDSGTRYLILDLRGNEGGNDYRGTLLMRYLAGEPFRYFDRLEAATKNKFSFAEQARLPRFYGLQRRLLRKTSQGKIVWTHSKGLGLHMPFKNHFDGKVYTLINGASFSVTAEFAAVAQHMGRAVFIGEETGGGSLGNNSGTFVIVTLPNSRLNIGIPMLAYYTAVDTPPYADRGVMPEYHVEAGIADLLQGRDRVMDFARSLPPFLDTIPDTVNIVFHTTMGDVEAELFPKQAPVTCRNFLEYTDRLGKSGGSFYRTVTPGNQPHNKVRIEVIQGGFNLAGIDTAALIPIPLERTRLTGLSHTDGALSMARSDPDSGSTEFFICIGDQPSLDFGGKRNPDGQGFAAFGKVTRGMDVVRAIQQSPSEEQGLRPAVGIMGIERR